jgi:hypothetical protein
MTENSPTREPAEVFSVKPIYVVAFAEIAFLEIGDRLSTPHVDSKLILYVDVRDWYSSAVE